MDSIAYENFTAKLLDTVRSDPDMLGIVFAGSTAAAARRDQWSDHDFLLVVKPGLQESYRQNLGWLPDRDSIVYHFRETEHGVNAIYASGHLIEFAVFDPEELSVMKANDYAVPVDKIDIGERMQAVAANSEPAPLDLQLVCGHLLQLVFAGTGRYARGEKLSAHTFIRQWALRRLLIVLPAVLKPENARKLDTLDPFRRVEQVLPEIAAQIDALNRLDILDTASGYLDVLEAHVRSHVPDYPDGLHAVVRAQIAKAHAI